MGDRGANSLHQKQKTNSRIILPNPAGNHIFAVFTNDGVKIGLSDTKAKPHPKHDGFHLLKAPEMYMRIK